MFRKEKKPWWSINKYDKLINYRYIKNSWKLINVYRFKDGSENVVFKFSIANKKLRLLGSYRPPSQNEMTFIKLALTSLAPYTKTFS